MNSKFHDVLMMNDNAFSVGNYHFTATTNLIIYVDAQCQSLTLLGRVSNWTWTSVLHCLVTETDTHNHPQVRTLFRASSGTTHICAHLMRLGLLLHNKQIIECAFEGTYNSISWIGVEHFNSCRVKLWLPPPPRCALKYLNIHAHNLDANIP